MSPVRIYAASLRTGRGVGKKELLLDSGRLREGGANITSPRLRRIAPDYQALRADYSGHPNIQIEPLGPAPPEAYRITYRLPGLVLNGDVPGRSDLHVCEIRLPWGY